MNKRLAACLAVTVNEPISNDAMNRGVVRYFRHSDKFNEMLATQKRKCAICGNACKTERSLAVDHCHKTGKIRGLLCGKCNVTLGLVDDDVDRLKKMIAYLESHK